MKYTFCPETPHRRKFSSQLNPKTIDFTQRYEKSWQQTWNLWLLVILLWTKKENTLNRVLTARVLFDSVSLEDIQSEWYADERYLQSSEQVPG